jgi:two-component system cell cycle sensor histidine kinase/response regulator CckA
MTTEESALFRALSAATPAAIFVVQDDRVRFANPAAEKLTGYSQAELTTMNLFTLLEGASTGAPMGRHEVKLRTREGSLRWIDLTIAPFELDGKPALIGTALDVTDRKHFDLHSVQAERLQAVGRLAGGIAHDFNNLLLVIAGQSEQLADGLASGDPLLPAVTAISDAARRAASLTQQLLAFSQRQTLVPRAVSLASMVEQMRGVLRDTMGSAITVHVDLAAQVPTVRADRAQLERVLINLALNARDAMGGRGQLAISLDTIQVGDAMMVDRPWLRIGRYVRMQLRDSGAGMSEEVQQHLFEPFFTTKPPGTGAGLGLATVYGIVKQSGGFVWVESEVGRGTLVTILLPPVDVIVEDVQPRKAPVSSRPVVLVVEDETAVRDLLVTILKRGGFDVRSADSAEAALAIDDHYDLLLTDVVLPRMTGPDLARAVRERSPQTRVLFMSGYTGNAVLDETDLDAGRAFIQKPFSSKALVDRIRDLIDLTPQPEPR